MLLWFNAGENETRDLLRPSCAGCIIARRNTGGLRLDPSNSKRALRHLDRTQTPPPSPKRSRAPQLKRRDRSTLETERAHN